MKLNSTTMKKVLMLFAALLLTLTASAQFEEGKKYVGASLSGLDLSYNGSKELSFGVQGKAGCFVADNLLLYGTAGYDHAGKDIDDYFSVGAGGRYYITQNGIFLGANVKYIHANSDYNDFMPGVEVGYAFFVSRTVTIEPSIYYQQSFKDHSNYSTIGLQIGFGIYLGKD
jgi:hypothetical protein